MIFYDCTDVIFKFESCENFSIVLCSLSHKICANVMYLLLNQLIFHSGDNFGALISELLTRIFFLVESFRKLENYILWAFRKESLLTAINCQIFNQRTSNGRVKISIRIAFSLELAIEYKGKKDLMMPSRAMLQVWWNGPS